MDRDWIGNIEPWGRMVHLTPMERQRTGPYGPVVYDVGIKASNFETNQASQTLGQRNSRSEVTSIPHPEGPASVLTNQVIKSSITWIVCEAGFNSPRNRRKIGLHHDPTIPGGSKVN